MRDCSRRTIGTRDISAISQDTPYWQLQPLDCTLGELRIHVRRTPDEQAYDRILYSTTNTFGQMLSAVFLGAFWHQLTCKWIRSCPTSQPGGTVSLNLACILTVLAHDAGHTGITGKAATDRFIGTIVADWVGGLSLSWWKDVS